MSARIPALVAVVMLAFSTATPGAASDTAQKFDDANAAFATGDFARAIREDEAVVHSGEWSTALFYDLGNAYFRAGDPGRAVLSYERALLIEPAHPETEANLRNVRERARALGFATPPLSRYLSFLRPDAYTIAAALLFWLGVFLLVRRPRGGSLATALICFVLCAGCVFAVRTLLDKSAGKAIIVGKEVEARVATADTAKSVLALPPGSAVTILQKRGDWSYAVLPNNERGWILSDAVEFVQL